MKKALIVFVKAPGSGKVKTRLQPCLAPEKVMEIYKSFVIEILAKCFFGMLVEWFALS